MRFLSLLLMLLTTPVAAATFSPADDWAVHLHYCLKSGQSCDQTWLWLDDDNGLLAKNEVTCHGLLAQTLGKWMVDNPDKRWTDVRCEIHRDNI